MGGAATGDFAIGGVATGGFATGGVAIGGIVTGGFATGGVATGGFAMGGVAIGGFATGGVATGDISVGHLKPGGGFFPQPRRTSRAMGKTRSMLRSLALIVVHRQTAASRSTKPSKTGQHFCLALCPIPM